jgi:aspartyl-tRNA(Asn)/glutamyl-tRNA(Gln) amidotransferase subunit A
MINVTTLTITEAHAGLMAHTFSVKELVYAYLSHAKKQNGDFHAFLEFFDGEALDEQISRAQQAIDSGNAHILCGIPYAVKDNILVKGHIASASSKILENYVASYSATVIQKLDAVHAICIGRTNMDEFAMGSSTENSAYGPTKNPIDPTRVPGGSSGGSAAAVAMHGCLFALGTDTGGSIRQPAAFCGIVGVYPTYGCVSRHGSIAMGSSLDQIGPFANNVEDAQRVLDCIAGPDGMDATTISLEKRVALASGAHKKVIGVPRKLLELEGIAPEVKVNIDLAIKSFESAGYEIRDIDLPHAHLGLAVYYIVMPAEVSSNLARFDGMRYGLRTGDGTLLDTYLNSRHDGFGKETRRRIMLGTYVLSAGYYDAYYTKAQKVRSLIKQDYEQVFATGVSAVITPTTPTVAFRPGEKVDPLSMYLADIFTVTANLCHMPAISIPSGTNREGLPFGIQITCNQGREKDLFEIASDFEKTNK